MQTSKGMGNHLPFFIRERRSYFTASLKALPTVNFGIFLAGILIISAVRGFLPFRAFLLTDEICAKPSRAIIPGDTILNP